MRLLEAAIQRVRRMASIRPAINDHYVTTKPSAQNAIDIFEGEWASIFPEPLAAVSAGRLPLFDDGRIRWAGNEIGGFSGRSALDLGPLEGGHAYMMERMGAAEITSVEANTRAYLKCLIAKDLLGMRKVKFLCGDFLEYLRDGSCPQFDVCVASGVLYHMRNPAELIGLLASRCKGHIVLWTHYYDAHHWKASSTHDAEYKGFEHRLFRHDYGRRSKSFCGGTASFSHWMRREDILDCLKHFGFGRIHIRDDDFENGFGAAMTLTASRT